MRGFYQKLAPPGPTAEDRPAMGALWTLLVVASVVVAALTGRVADLTAAVTESAGKAVTISLGLVGVLSLWLGLMRVAEEAGLVALLARALRPVLRRLFPEVPDAHPALGSMVMNIAANLLGLGNAATPFGVKAMQELETLNPRQGTATDAQALFCAMNTASLQLVPASVIALRAGAGSRAPAEILGATLVASACGVVVAVAVAKLLARLTREAP
jgi:spore maturation protein A